MWPRLRRRACARRRAVIRRSVRARQSSVSAPSPLPGAGGIKRHVPPDQAAVRLRLTRENDAQVDRVDGLPTRIGRDACREDPSTAPGKAP